MREDIWVEEEDDGRRRPRSVLAILAIAAIPWVIVAAILLPERDDPSDEHPEAEGEQAQDDRSDDGSDATSDSPPSLATEEAPDEATTPSDRGDGASGTVDVPAPPSRTAGDGSTADLALASTATVVARAWATGIDPHLDVPGVDPDERPRYVEHVAVEAIERSGSGLAVVTLVAVILEDLDDGLGADLRRIAVPLAIQDGSPRLAGMPWWLPPPAIHPAEVATEQVTDPMLLDSAIDALLRAGYEDAEVQTLYRTPEWPWIAGFTAVAPGGEEVIGEVWLRQEEDGFVLAGHLPEDARRDGGRP